MSASDGTTRPRRSRRPRAIVAVISTTLLSAGALSACAGGAGDDGGSTITVSHGFTDAEASSLTALTAQWNKEHPTTKVTLQFNGGNDNAVQKTLAGFTSGNYPDVAYEFGSSSAQLARQPKLVDLTGRVKAPEVDWDDFSPAIRKAASVDGKVVGVPALVDNLSLVYNKAVFDEAGVAPPTNDWTWQDFRAAAKKLSDPAKRKFGWAYVNDGTEDTVWRFLAMLWQAGGELTNAAGTKPEFDSPAGLAALTQLRDMAVVDKSVYLDSGNQNYLNLFNSGKIAMLWTGPWDLSSINADVKYGVTYLPGYNGNHETISGPDIYMLFDHSAARTDTAFKFVAWLTSAKVHLQFAIATGDLPLRTSETSLPGYQTFLKKYPEEKTFVDNLDNVKHARPNVAGYAQASTAIGQMVQAVLLGQAQPSDALKSASAAVAAALSAS